MTLKNSKHTNTKYTTPFLQLVRLNCKSLAVMLSWIWTMTTSLNLGRSHAIHEKISRLLIHSARSIPDHQWKSTHWPIQ